MLKKLDCPTCGAPVELSSETIVRCTYCQGSIVVPQFDNKSTDNFDDAKKAKLEAVLSAVLKQESIDHSNVVINVHDKESLKRISKRIGEGNNDGAVRVMSSTYGFEGGEAQEIIKALTNGDSIDLNAVHKKYHPTYSHEPQSSWSQVIIGLFAVGALIALIALANYLLT